MRITLGGKVEIVLSDQEKRFIEAYVTILVQTGEKNAIKAAEMSGFGSTELHKGERLVERSDIREAIIDRLKKCATAVSVTPEFVLKSLLNIYHMAIAAVPVVNKYGVPIGKYVADLKTAEKVMVDIGTMFLDLRANNQLSDSEDEYKHALEKLLTTISKDKKEFSDIGNAVDMMMHTRNAKEVATVFVKFLEDDEQKALLPPATIFDTDTTEADILGEDKIPEKPDKPEIPEPPQEKKSRGRPKKV